LDGFPGELYRHTEHRVMTMTANIITFPIPSKDERIPKEMEVFFADLTLGFRSEHCEPPRLALE
ncbi:TPA: hypothetical protein ACNVQO_003773, partial [Pseudomonas putida]